MGILECASGVSVWRGYEYYQEKKVMSLEVIEANIFSAKVSGNSSTPYSVKFMLTTQENQSVTVPTQMGNELSASILLPRTLLHSLKKLRHFTQKSWPIKRKRNGGRRSSNSTYATMLGR